MPAALVRFQPSRLTTTSTTYQIIIMADPVTSAAEKIAEETTRGIFRNVGNMNAVVGMLCIFFVIGGFAFAGAGLWIFSKSQEVNNLAVKASTEAIASNADTIRRMGKSMDDLAVTVEAIKDTERKQEQALEESKRDRVIVMANQKTILEHQEQTFAEHKALIQSAQQSLDDHKKEIDLLTKGKSNGANGG
jgi:hypothetical protein